MRNRKYKIRKDLSIEFEGRTLYRIEALKNINRIVSKGDIGGYIENQSNLSTSNDCWIFDNAKVFNNAMILNNAKIFNNAIVKNHAAVAGNSRVTDDALINGHVHLYNYAYIGDHAQALDLCYVSDHASVLGHAIIKDSVDIRDMANIGDNVTVSGCAVIAGNAFICGEVTISNTNDVLVLGPIGSRNAYTTFIKQPDRIFVRCECFFGNIKEFEVKVSTRYNDYNINYSAYMAAIEYAEKHFEIYSHRE